MQIAVMKRPWIAVLCAASIMLLLATATKASAEPAKAPEVMVVKPAITASETDGAKVSPPGGDTESEPQWLSCLTQGSTGNIACFESYGDKFYVYDGNSDGASAVAYWWTNYGAVGLCYNSHGAGNWAVCNYDMREDGIVHWRTCYRDRSAGGSLFCTSTYASRHINGN
jgi:hypothetical protein